LPRLEHQNTVKTSKIVAKTRTTKKGMVLYLAVI